MHYITRIPTDTYIRGVPLQKLLPSEGTMEEEVSEQRNKKIK